MLRKNDSILRWLIDNLEELLGAGLLAAMLMIVVVGVLFRYLFLTPLRWSEEAPLALFVWLVFIGAAAVSKSGSHPRIDFISFIFTPGVDRLFTIIGYVIVLSLLAVMVGLGGLYATMSWDSYTIALKLPLFWINLSIPVGSSLMLWRTIQRLVVEIQSRNLSRKRSPVTGEIL